VLPGTVQITPAGNLMVLMREAQTTGGYPRILQLTTESINALAQLKTGDTFRIKILDVN
jgi:allophanate hydrolase subunit 2